jgi:hypothetical protein
MSAQKYIVKNSSFAAAGLDPKAGKTNKEMTMRANNTNQVFLIVFPPFCIVITFHSSAFYAAFSQCFHIVSRL